MEGETLFIFGPPSKLQFEQVGCGPKMNNVSPALGTLFASFDWLKTLGHQPIYGLSSIPRLRGMESPHDSDVDPVVVLEQGQ
jgi:hypothetical protein